MSALIDLREYVAEVKAFASLASDFVEKSSTVRLDELVRTLETGIAAGRATWAWETRDPVEFGPSRNYDGPNRDMDEAWVKLAFRCEFSRPLGAPVPAKDGIWKIVTSAVHVTMTRRDENDLCLHFDYKNLDQWGPQLHVQVDEHPHRFPIPRLPAAVFLPTDCADLVLWELMPEAWQRHQRRNNNSVAPLRNAQETVPALGWRTSSANG